MYVFVSHSSKDFDVAEKMCNLIETNGHNCFLAPRDIRTGYEYAEEIIRGIERADAVLLLLSKEANSSPHVLREIERAVSKKIRIIVYKLEDVELSKSMEYFLMSHQWIHTLHGDIDKEIIKSLSEKTEQGKDITAQSLGKEKNSVPKGKKILLLITTLLLLLGGLLLYFAIKEKDVIDVSPGATVVFGTYNGEPIEWRVLRVSADGKEAVVVAKHILTMKAFDAAESGKYNFYDGRDYWGEDISDEDISLQYQLRGNSQWSVSNIRTWLNATEENVKYADQKPNAAAMSGLQNGYDAEAGFLSNFSEEELQAILLTDVVTNGEITEDKVFLLAKDELTWFEEADVKLAAIPTAAACEQDKTDWYEVYALELGAEDYSWWLRDTDMRHPYEAYMVCNSYSTEQITLTSVGLEGYGIRPAMTIDLTKKGIVVK